MTTAYAKANDSKQRNAKQTAARRRAIRERVAQTGGHARTAANPLRRHAIKNVHQPPLDHAQHIGAFHALEKRLGRTTDETERQRLLEEQQRLGGLAGYQAASLQGAEKGETSYWLCAQLDRSRTYKLLDVGAIAGTAYSNYAHIEATSIDLNPQSPNVAKMDFLDMPRPSNMEESFDIVALSLVLNYVGNLRSRSKRALPPAETALTAMY